MFIRFDMIHERDRHTDGRTDTAWRHSPRLCIASRGKNCNVNVLCVSSLPVVLRSCEQNYLFGLLRVRVMKEYFQAISDVERFRAAAKTSARHTVNSSQLFFNDELTVYWWPLACPDMTHVYRSFTHVAVRVLDDMYKYTNNPICM